jgi:hypothetical protein
MLTSLFCKLRIHLWDKGEYVAEDSCEQDWTCISCGKVKRFKASHTWGPDVFEMREVPYRGRTYCGIVRQGCLRCGKKDWGLEKHDWSVPSERGNVKRYTCLTCGKVREEKKYDNVGFDW